MKTCGISRQFIQLLVLFTMVSMAAYGGSLNLDVTGTLGPLLSGMDPLHLSGKDFSATGTFDLNLTPASTTSDSATYNLPADLQIMVGALDLTGYAPTLTLTAPPSGPDTLSLAFSVVELTLTPQVSATVSLAQGTLSGTALQVFSAGVTQPDSFLWYEVFGSSQNLSGQLGITGTASVTSAGGPSVPEPATIGLMFLGVATVIGRVCKRGRSV